MEISFLAAVASATLQIIPGGTWTAVRLLSSIWFALLIALLRQIRVSISRLMEGVF